MSGLTLYTLASCDTCRKAVKLLRASGWAFVEKPIRETPPSLPELCRMLEALQGDRGRLFNTAGREYREQRLGETLPGLSDRAALELLANDGRLVKRPFLVGPEVALVGFDETRWKQALAVR
jgi:arsenate reductase